MAATTAPRTVASVMSRDPICISRTASVADAAELLDAYAIGGLAVVDGSGELVGVVSQADLVRLRASDLPWNGWHGIQVADVMSRPAWTIAPTEPLAEAAALMSSRRVHRLVVVDPEGEPIGIVAQSDLVREIAEACDDD
jgi:CBS domain-containing protein